MNVIVLEGPDCSGKSTFATTLVGMGYKYVHFSVPPKEALASEEAIFQFYLKPLLQIDQRDYWVIDRCHLSERIYGPVMRDGTHMTERGERLIERYLEAIDAQVVICLPPERIALAAWMDRRSEEYVQDIKKFGAIYDGYMNLLFSRTRNSNFVWYDYTRHRMQSFASALMTLQGLPLPEGMVGSQRARFLFVGERANDKPDLPFMTTLNSSGWLYNCIKDAGFDERDICFGNALKLDGALNNMSTMWGVQTYGSQVIALGNIAHRALADSDIDHVSIEHPQYWKRFHNGNREIYVKKLAKIRRQAR